MFDQKSYNEQLEISKNQNNWTWHSARFQFFRNFSTTNQQ